MATLQSRLGDSRYVNFLKTGICLADLKDGLEELANCKSQELQNKVLSSLQHKNNPSRKGLCGDNSVIKKRGNNWSIECNGNYCINCTGFIGEVQNYCSYDFPVGNIYWKNTKCSLWSCKGDHWQLAKLFILNKDPKVSPMSAAETDLAGILWFFENCSLARRCVTDRTNIQKVRDVRNAYMHISKARMSGREFMTKSDLLLDLLNDINANNKLMDLDVAIWKIKKVRSTQFSIKPIHEFMVMSEMLNAVEEHYINLLQQVTDLGNESKRLETVQKDLFLELNEALTETAKKLESDCDEINDKFNSLKLLVVRGEDMINALSKQVDNVDKSVKRVKNSIDVIKMYCENIRKQRGIDSSVLALTGGIVGGIFGAVGGPAGIAAGAALGAGIGKGVGKLLGKGD